MPRPYGFIPRNDRMELDRKKMNRKKYEHHFTEFAEKYWPNETADDPQFYTWFIAQAMAESALKPSAVSLVGACGIMQIMPATWRDIRMYLPHLPKDIFDVRANIEAGIWYDRYCWDRFPQIENPLERLLFALAGYNCGPSRVRKLITASGAKTYAEI
ncbi:MAG TPA: hypothetical protein ENN07_04725, partial [candidate division Zixibacteria bacterium]|nr:hypothetical protein [candidate division Zixibacteria bacterium]